MRTQATDYLAAFFNYENQLLRGPDTFFDLKRIGQLLDSLHHPEKKYPVIHVLGTKGKGSTSLFIASMLRAAGLKTGLYTSPHLYDCRERIRILDPLGSSLKANDIFEGQISFAQQEKALREIRPKIENIKHCRALGPLSFFEVYTALAFYFFAQQKIDVAVIEAGLGGRLDATNVTASDICVFTPISYDHTRVLGKTLTRIAKEKAAVIKQGTRAVFSAPQQPQVRLVIQGQARKNKCSLVEVGREVRYQVKEQFLSGVSFSLKGLFSSWPKLHSPLLGEHQVVNASLAAAVVEYFLKDKRGFVREAVIRGLSSARWPARFEIIGRNPFVVIDSAHNEDSAKKLAETMRGVFPKQKVIMLFGASNDKDIRAILKRLAPVSSQTILTCAQHPRSFDFSKNGIKFLDIKGAHITSDAREGFRLAKTMACVNDVILVAGSVFLAAEIRKLCLSRI